MLPGGGDGPWSEDARSVASQSELSYASRPRSAASQTQGRDRNRDRDRDRDITPRSDAQRSHASRSDAGSQAPQTQAPWATGDPPRAHGEGHGQKPRQRASSTADVRSERRAERQRPEGGEYLGWRDFDDSKATKKHPGIRNRTREDFLHWCADTPRLDKPGKRLYEKPPPAGEQAPYGRCNDGPARSNKTAQPQERAPFGTEQDMQLRRPEDAGTNEYRAALTNQRRR